MNTDPETPDDAKEPADMIRKTAAITAASIAGVVLAGGIAVGANIGILNAADSGSLGELSAEAPITTQSAQPVVALEPVAKAGTSTDNSQTFTVDVAGQVEIKANASGPRLGRVRANQGWSWKKTSTTDAAVMVLFSADNGDQLIFTATLNEDGTISARIDRPAPSTTPPSTPATTDSSRPFIDDDGFEEDHEDDHGDDELEHEDEEHEDEEHEGRDEDD